MHATHLPYSTVDCWLQRELILDRFIFMFLGTSSTPTGLGCPPHLPHAIRSHPLATAEGQLRLSALAPPPSLVHVGGGMGFDVSTSLQDTEAQVSRILWVFQFRSMEFASPPMPFLSMKPLRDLVCMHIESWNMVSTIFSGFNDTVIKSAGENPSQGEMELCRQTIAELGLPETMEILSPLGLSRVQPQDPLQKKYPVSNRETS